MDSHNPLSQPYRDEHLSAEWWEWYEATHPARCHGRQAATLDDQYSTTIVSESPSCDSTTITNSFNEQQAATENYYDSSTIACQSPSCDSNTTLDSFHEQQTTIVDPYEPAIILPEGPHLDFNTTSSSCQLLRIITRNLIDDVELLAKEDGNNMWKYPAACAWLLAIAVNNNDLWNNSGMIELHLSEPPSWVGDILVSEVLIYGPWLLALEDLTTIEKVKVCDVIRLYHLRESL